MTTKGFIKKRNWGMAGSGSIPVPQKIAKLFPPTIYDNDGIGKPNFMYVFSPVFPNAYYPDGTGIMEFYAWNFKIGNIIYDSKNLWDTNKYVKIKHEWYQVSYITKNLPTQNDIYEIQFVYQFNTSDFNQSKLYVADSGGSSTFYTNNTISAGIDISWETGTTSGQGYSNTSAGWHDGRNFSLLNTNSPYTGNKSWHDYKAKIHKHITYIFSVDKNPLEIDDVCLPGNEGMASAMTNGQPVTMNCVYPNNSYGHTFNSGCYQTDDTFSVPGVGNQKNVNLYNGANAFAWPTNVIENIKTYKYCMDDTHFYGPKTVTLLSNNFASNKNYQWVHRNQESVVDSSISIGNNNFSISDTGFHEIELYDGVISKSNEKAPRTITLTCASELSAGNYGTTLLQFFY